MTASTCSPPRGAYNRRDLEILPPSRPLQLSPQPRGQSRGHGAGAGRPTSSLQAHLRGGVGQSRIASTGEQVPWLPYAPCHSLHCAVFAPCVVSVVADLVAVFCVTVNAISWHSPLCPCGAVLERKQSISSMSGAMLSPRRSSRRNLQDDVLNAAAPSVAATQPKFVVYALSPLAESELRMLVLIPRAARCRRLWRRAMRPSIASRTLRRTTSSR